MTTNEMGDAAFRIEMIGVATPLQRKLALQLLIRKDALDIAEMLGLLDWKVAATMREDSAIIENAELHFAVASSEAQVKAARANANRLRTQVDIARSISVSVRNEMSVQ